MLLALLKVVLFNIILKFKWNVGALVNTINIFLIIKNTIFLELKNYLIGFFFDKKAEEE